jgi:stage IV sporulation protein FB
MLKFSGNIPVSIYPFFWVVAFLIGWLSTANVPETIIWMGVILFSVLIHEYGHALTTVLFGQKAQIELVGFGGVTHRRGEVKLNLWKEFIIVLNGPLAGFCLAGISWWLFNTLRIANPQSLWTYAVYVTYSVNFYWTIINLLPVQPLDGGKLLSILMESMFGLKGIKISLFISLLLGVGLGLFFFMIRGYFLGAIFLLFAFESYKIWCDSLSFAEIDSDAYLLDRLKEGDKQLRLGHKDEALKIFQEIREKSKRGLLYRTASESEANLLAEEGYLQQAYEILSQLGKQVTNEGLSLLHQLAYNQKNWKEAVAVGDKAYRNHPSYQVAIINAASHAALGNVKPAIGWIQSAINDGLPHVNMILDKEEFNPIRNDPLFREFLISRQEKA